MSARVVAYSADPHDTMLSIMVECVECGVEWGWSRDTPAANDRLDAPADIHNIDEHGYRRVGVGYDTP